MQTDELRAELTELAREVDPFPGDLAGARRRVARRRSLLGSVAVVVSIALVVAVVTATRSNPSRIHIAGTEKQVAIAELPRVDALVVLPAQSSKTDADHVQAILDRTSSVEKYAALPASTLARILRLDPGKAAAALRARVCAVPATRSYAVELTRTTRDPLSQTTAAVGTAATVLSIGKPGVDIEVFMRVKATAAQVAAVRARIAADPSVTSYRFLSQQDALREFRKLFSDQPGLIEKTPASSLPESFRLEVSDGASKPALAAALGRLPGTDQVITSTADALTRTAPEAPSDQVEVFMQVKASHREIAAVRAALAQDQSVSSSRFLTHEDAYNEFKREFAGQPDVLRGTSPDALPTSFRVTLVSAPDSTTFQRRYEAYAGVDTVQISRGALADACSPLSP